MAILPDPTRALLARTLDHQFRAILHWGQSARLNSWAWKPAARRSRSDLHPGGADFYLIAIL